MKFPIAKCAAEIFYQYFVPVLVIRGAQKRKILVEEKRDENVKTVFISL